MTPKDRGKTTRASPRTTAPSRPPTEARRGNPWEAILRRRGWRIGMFAVVLGLAVYVRLVHLGADPPADAAWGHDIVTDPPHYTADARNAVAFGEWDPFGDDRYIIYRKNLTAIASYIMFSVFGPGIATANLTAAVLSLVGLACFTWAVGRAFGFLAGLSAAWLLTMNYLFVGYGRQPFLEVGSNCLLAIAFLFLVDSARWWQSALIAGCATSAAILFGKATALHALPAFAIGAALVGWNARADALSRRWARPAGFVAGLGGVAAVWYIVAYRQASAEVLAYLKEMSLSLYGSPVGLSSVGEFLRQWFSFGVNTWLLTWSPILSVIGLAGMAVAIVHYSRGGSWRRIVESTPPALVMALLWFWGGWLALSPFNYRPVRYQTVLMLPLAAAAGWLIQRWAVGDGRTMPGRDQRPSWWVVPPLAVILSVGIKHFFDPPTWSRPESRWNGRAHVVAVIVAGLLAAAGWYLLAVRGDRRGQLRVWLRQVAALLAGVVLIGVLVDQGRHFLSGWSRRQYALAAANRDLAAIVGPDAVFTGELAATLCQLAESPRGVNHFFVLREPTGFFSRFPITHVAIEDRPDGPFFKDFPELAKGAERVTTYSIYDIQVAILRIGHLTGNSQAAQYRLSPFERLRLDVKGRPLDSILPRLPSRIADSADTYSGWRWLGELYTQTDSLAGAIAAYRRALTFSPDDYVLLFRAGDLAWKRFQSTRESVDKTTAAEFWRRALRFSPNYPPLRQRLAAAGG